VSLELRYGIWPCLAAAAAITSPSAESDLLMFCASFSLYGQNNLVRQMLTDQNQRHPLLTMFRRDNSELLGGITSPSADSDFPAFCASFSLPRLALQQQFSATNVHRLVQAAASFEVVLFSSQ